MKKWFLFLLVMTGCHHTHEPLDAIAAIQIYDRNGMTETISNSERLEVYEKVDFLTSQPYQKVVRVYRKEGKSHSKITTYHPNGSIKQYLEAEEMRAHGAFKEWHPNGTLRIEATVIGGTADIALGSEHDWLFDGTCRVWDEKGHLMAEIPYKGGFLEGVSFHYYESGGVKKELPYANHLLNGVGVEYYPSGAIRAMIHFEKDLRHGPSIGYFDTGEVCWQEEWVDGRLNQASYFNVFGKKIGEVKDGEGLQIAFNHKSIAQKIEIKNGLSEGVVKNYGSDGDLTSEYRIRNGKKYGEETIYFPKNQLPKMRLHWDGNAIHGIVQTWYDTGQLQSEREYGHNKKMGTSLAWYKNGALMFVEEYENDTLMKGRYYKKGSKEPISTVQNGNGTAHLYDEEGILLRKVQFQKGKALDPES